jgi:acyl-CoA thioesterase II
MTEIESAWPRYPDYKIDLVPCRGRARVHVGDTILAESSSAIRLIETDHVERLYIPESDVRLDLLGHSDTTTICPFKGEASYWSFNDSDIPVEDVFWTYRQPFDEVSGIRGYLGVYHEKVRVDVTTEWPDRTASLNRFPFWGDEDDLLAVLEPELSGDGMFIAPKYHDLTRNVVEGGQLLGQAIVAAGRTVPEQRVTWASMSFIRAARFDSTVDVEAETARRGSTLSTITTRSTQSGKLVATGLALLDTGADDAIRHVAPMPTVGRPDQAEPFDMGVIGRDLRVVDGAYSPDPDRVGPPTLHVWIRYREDPKDPVLRSALVAQPTTHWTIAAAMRPHAGVGEAQAHVTLSTAPVALALSFHDDAPLDQWLLYSTDAIWSGRGLVQGRGTVFTEDGVLVASFTLQAIVRDMPPSISGDTPRAM